MSAMKRQRRKLTNDDSKGTTFHYITRSRSKDISITETLEKTASLGVTKQRKKKKVSEERSTNLDLQLPIDLIVEILKRLPAKTLAKFLCVSKVWSSTIRGKDFKKLFFAESSNRPGRLFFAFKRDKNCFLFSLNQIPNPGEITYHLAHPVSDKTLNYSSCLHDLICYGTGSDSELVVYNSTTRRFITLPSLEIGTFVLKHFLCYDPIDAIYKVLCLCMNKARILIKVLTLGNGNEWRILKETHTHFPFTSQICINGVLYYDAYADKECKEAVVMSFDVSSENFDLIKGPGSVELSILSTMTIYGGKPSIISYEISANGSMVLWVLEDALKHEWLKKIFVLPKSLAHGPCVPPPHEFHFLNITVAGEFILAPLTTSVAPSYVLYYDPKRNSIRKVSIEGIRDHGLYRLNREKSWFLYHLFSTQAESLTFW